VPLSFPMPADWWAELAAWIDATGLPWHPHACAGDYLEHVSAYERGERRGDPPRHAVPGSPFFAARWRVTDYRARQYIAQAQAAIASVRLSTAPDHRAPAVDLPEAADQQRGAQGDPHHDRRGGRSVPLPFDSASTAPLITSPVRGSDLSLQREIDRAAVDPASLSQPAGVFLAVYRAGRGVAGLAWRDSEPIALGWFAAEIEQAPAYIGLDLVPALRAWGDSLAQRRQGQSGRRYPRDWRSALRRWLDKRLALRASSRPSGYTDHTTGATGHDQPPRHDATPRGAWAGQEQPAGFAPRGATDDDFDAWEAAEP